MKTAALLPEADARVFLYIEEALAEAWQVTTVSRLIVQSKAMALS
jgi:hypothetical protein